MLSVGRVLLTVTLLLAAASLIAPQSETQDDQPQQPRQYGPRLMAGANQSDPITRSAAAIGLAQLEGSGGGLWTSSSQHQADLVRKLYDEIAARVAEDFSIVIFNHANENKHDLRDVEAWRVLKIGQFDYDVWLFKCGIVLNTKAARGFDNWTYGGPCWFTTNGGNKVHFLHPECPNYEMRQTQRCGQHT